MGGQLSGKRSSEVATAVALSAEKKSRDLEARLREMGSVVVAFSGGVDSSYLALAAHRSLGSKALAVTGVSASVPAVQMEMARRVVAGLGMAHVTIETAELDSDAYRANAPDRCFHCKSELFSRLTALAKERGFRFVADGANADDLVDFRPGRRAAKLLGVRSPLEEVGLTKAEIRQLSRDASLPTADEPASACLSSRIAYFTPVTVERLRQVEEGENALRAMGFRHFRVRHHDTLVRLEFLPQEMPRALSMEMTTRFVEIFKLLGYAFVTIDLEGYRTGSLNEVLEKQ